MQLLSVNGKMAEDNENHLQGELPGTKEGLQKLYQVSGKKRTPKLAPSCLDYDNLSLSIMLMQEVKACNRGASRLGEAWARPRFGRKTYWHKDKARLMGTRN